MPPRIDVHYTPITLARRKKHRVRLTDGVRNRRNRLASHRRRRTATSRTTPARSRVNAILRILRSNKKPYGIYVFTHIANLILMSRARRKSNSTDAEHIANGVTVSVLPRSKIFSTDAPAEALRRGGFDQKRANRVPSDSHRGALTRRRARIARGWREPI